MAVCLTEAMEPQEPVITLVEAGRPIMGERSACSSKRRRGRSGAATSDLPQDAQDALSTSTPAEAQPTDQ